MQDLSAFLREITALRGISGEEISVSRAIYDAFRAHTDDVSIDAMQSVTARIGTEGPRVMITAHIDEIGLTAMLVEDDGAVRFGRIGGVDPRILPGSRVTVHTDEGPKTGVVGAKPPHLLTAEDRAKNYKMTQLYVDLGMPVDRVKALVRPGTPITLAYTPVMLQNRRMAVKTVDDRGSVAVMLRTMELLKNAHVPAQVSFVAAVQEEVGGIGADTSAYRENPDIGIAIDVTHAQMPDCDPDDVFPLEKVVLTEGPNIHPKVLQRLVDTAAAIRVDIQKGICPRITWTDASSLQIARAGVPTALIEVPLKYMHTTVETVALSVLEESARLLAAFIQGLTDDLEEWLCF